MKVQSLLVALVATVLLGTGALAAACGGNGGDQLTLDEFFQELQALDDELETQSNASEAQFDELTEESSIEDIAKFFRAQGALIEEFVESIADLNPPDEAADVHSEAVEAGRAVVAAFEDVIREAAEATSVEDFFAVFEDADFSAADDRFTQACLAAGQLAADNSITVDFSCEDDE